MEFKIDTKTGHEVIPLWINGRAETSSPSKRFSVRSASLQKTVHVAESADEAAAIRAADVAWNAFHTWKKTSGSTRRKIILRYAALLRENEKMFVEAQQMETSATKQWAEKSLAMSATYVEEIASHITSIAGSIPQSESPDCLALSFREPIGPVLTISP
jgi:salicylaldehyde dehydrogenase